jgi:dTDP-4-amino-4,6-dideoxygalactose transaminase
VQVQLVDLKAQFQTLRSEVMQAIEDVLSSGELFLGPNTRAFEDEYAAYCGAQFCIGVGNGTDALHLALRAAGIGRGDEVITVSHTFIATIEAIELVGARPVLVDIDPRTFNIAPESIERAITPRTKAIIPVHLYGRLADMDVVLEIASRRQLIVIEDASQSQGAIDARGRRAGSLGHLGCFSFYYAKNLGAYGEAGAITTSDPELDRRIRLLRSHGESQRYEHEIMGFNCRPDEIQSAVLRIKLRHLDEWNDRRRQYAMRYHELLSDLAIELPELRFDGSHVYHQYVIRSSERDSLRQRLTEAGIGTGVHYPIPVHLQPAARGLGYARGDLPHTEAAASEVLSLPMFPELSEAQLTYVSEAVAAALQRPLSLAQLATGARDSLGSA